MLKPWPPENIRFGDLPKPTFGAPVIADSTFEIEPLHN
jgi:hypothetical protein